MLLDLSDRAKFKVTGKDRARFLNGQLTNDILSLRPGSAVCACALTAKGKLCAELFVAATKEGHFLDAEAVLRESLAARLERYIIADDVTLEEVTGEFGLFHLVNPVSGKAESPAAALPGSETMNFLIESNRFGVPGLDLWFPANRADAVREELGQSPVDPETAESFRIERGIARWGKELSEDVIPNEAGLDKRAISYGKGCYLGQEVISRIKSIGHVNRHLCTLVPAAGVTFEIGDKLFADGESVKEIGYVTSVGQSRSLDRAIALGYVRRAFAVSGTILQVRRNNSLLGPIEVRGLPIHSA
ncbi:MAG: folate-binding protein YgfZ [Verrucomicrobia bacterium]|nr:folate-binding protein YgfZ [Verrucomicrobiota bacterium]